ncbi:hypothetical protein [Thomasclavelia ramosa]|uniref:hypothetical protein n=1 Tax=Thomasclavelia ramosa TaxID=1547 RepID=UPI000E491E25|nr:hypothetical protein [Thomasclavelia ramosa]MDC2833728.1 hypothetical protein [Thomasclavelia ramosa]RGT26598.1 hypothetical protein DWX42_05235 [Thomasclavelia ramosa]
MRVFNEDKTQELKEYDLNKGHLELDKLFIRHHKAVEEIKEQWHYETIAEYPNGGKDVEKIIDVPYQAPQEAFDEYEDIYVYIPYTDEELEKLNKPSELEILKREQEVTAQAVQDLILTMMGGE